MDISLCQHPNLFLVGKLIGHTVLWGYQSHRLLKKEMENRFRRSVENILASMWDIEGAGIKRQETNIGTVRPWYLP